MNPDTLFLTRITLDHDSVIDPTRNQGLFAVPRPKSYDARIRSREVHAQLSYLYPEVPGGRTKFREFYNILWRYEEPTRTTPGLMYLSSRIPPHQTALDNGVGARNWKTKKYLPPLNDRLDYHLRVDFSPCVRVEGRHRAIYNWDHARSIATKWLGHAGLAPINRMFLDYLGKYEAGNTRVPVFRLNTAVEIRDVQATASALRDGLTTPAKCYGAGLISLIPTNL